MSRVIGVDLLAPEGDLLLSRALIDIYSHPLMSPEDAALVRAALDRVQHTPPQPPPSFEEDLDE
jgi:hypothetical protein